MRKRRIHTCEGSARTQAEWHLSNQAHMSTLSHIKELAEPAWPARYTLQISRDSVSIIKLKEEKTMQAVMKVAPGVGNVELREISDPEPPQGHVLIEVRAAGICGTDLHIYHDEFRTRPPVVIGHEVAGT